MSDIEALKKQLEEVLKKNADLEAANRKLSDQLASTSSKPAPVAVAAEGATAPVSGTIQFKEPTKKAAPAPVAAGTPASEGRVSSDATPPTLSRRGSVMTVVATYHGPEADPEDDEPDRVVVVIPADSVNGKEIDPFAHGALDLAVKSLVKEGDKLTVLVLSQPDSVVGGIVKLTTSSADPPRTERQSVNYVKAIATKIYNWYPKDFTFEVRSLPVKSDPVGAILEVCEDIQPSLLVIPRHKNKGTLWNTFELNLPSALFQKAEFPVIVVKSELPLGARRGSIGSGAGSAGPGSVGPGMSRTLTSESAYSVKSNGERVPRRRKSVAETFGLAGRDPTAPKEEGSGATAIGAAKFTRY